MMRIFLCVLGAAAVFPTPAAADMIFTPLFTFLLPMLGVPTTAFAFGSTTWVSLLSGIASIAFGLGVMMLLTPKPPKPENGHVAVQQPVPGRIFAYGRCRLAGVTVFAEQVGGTLYRIHALTGHRILGIVGWYLNDDWIIPPSDGYPTGDSHHRYGGKHVNLETRLGVVPETAYADVVAEMEGDWTENHRGDGCASLRLSAKSPKSRLFAKIYPYGEPKPSVVADCAPVFDPRDPDHAWDDPETWTASGYDNPILALLHWECFSPFGTGRDYTRAVAPVLDRWIAEADVCDELVPLKAGGVEKRYRVGFWGSTDTHDPRSGRQAILQTCDGWMVERGDGTIIPSVGRYVEPTVTLGDDDIAGWSRQSNAPNAERYEAMTAKYTSPANGYATVETDPRRLDNGAIAPDQNRVSSLDMTGVQSTGQASRLLAAQAHRYESPVRGTLVCRLHAIDAMYERWIRIDASIPGLKGMVIENRRPVLSLLKGRFTIEYVVAGEDIYAYSAVTDESAPPYVALRPAEKELPIPIIVSTVAEQVSSGGTVSTWIDVTIEAPQKNGKDREDLSYGLKWRAAGSSTWTTSVVDEFDIVAHQVVLQTGLVATGTTYELSLASIGSTGTYSTWCEPVTVSTAPTSVAPASPSLSVLGGAGSATATIGSPNSPNVAAVRLWRAPGGGSFVDAVDALGAVWCGPNQSLVRVDASRPAGSWRYWATAENSAGTRSTPTGPVTVTIT